MKITPTQPPRRFKPSRDLKVELSECAKIALDPDELVTFITESGTEYDVVRKNWGYYATPSLNGRLKDFHLRAVLVKNSQGRFLIMLVEEGKETLFMEYLQQDSQKIVTWLDSDEALARLTK